MTMWNKEKSAIVALFHFSKKDIEKYEVMV